MNMENILQLTHVRKSYGIGSIVETEVLHGIDITLKRASFSALTGPSGSGKSTLLNLIGLLEAPSSGELIINGQNDQPTQRSSAHATQRTQFRLYFSIPSFVTCI
jgi:ABC-type lipoprotein export system ATPase subunit